MSRDATGQQMLIDSLLPQFDFSELHSRRISAPVECTYEALRTADLGGHVLIKLLMGLRGLPAVLIRRERAENPFGKITLDVITRHGFEVIGEECGKELVIGIVGPFWKLTGNVVPFVASDFSSLNRDDVARAAWNFVVRPEGDGTILSTETRVACPSASTRRRFGFYWMLIRPFSGLIRRLMLRSIEREALKSSGPESADSARPASAAARR